MLDPANHRSIISKTGSVIQPSAEKQPVWHVSVRFKNQSQYRNSIRSVTDALSISSRLKCPPWFSLLSWCSAVILYETDGIEQFIKHQAPPRRHKRLYDLEFPYKSNKCDVMKSSGIIYLFRLFLWIALLQPVVSVWGTLKWPVRHVFYTACTEVQTGSWFHWKHGDCNAFRW